MEHVDHSTQPKSVSQSIDFYKIFKVFLSRWYWILTSVILLIIGAKLYLWYTPPIYSVSASLKLQDLNTGLYAGNNAAVNYNYTDRILAESFVIKSNDVILKAIGNLDYKVTYFLEGRVRTSETYPSKPFQIDIVKQEENNFSRALYEVEAKNDFSFYIKDTSSPKSGAKEVKYGDIITMGNMQFRILSPIAKNAKYSFKFNSKEEFIGRILGGMNVYEAGRFTNVMNISLTDINPNFAADILNSIMKEYTAYDIILKRQSAQQTLDFIDNQLSFIDTAAGKSGNTFADYKTKNKMLDLNSSTTSTVTKLSDLEKQKSALELQKFNISQIEQQIERNQNKITLGIDVDGSLNSNIGNLISNFNVLVSNRDADLNQFTPTSQPIREYDKKIALAKAAIKNSIQLLKTKNQQEISFTNNQISVVNQSIGTIPVKEQSFVRLQTNFEVNNKVRSYLSEKKLEAEMNAAAIVGGATIVNPAYPSSIPIFPNSGSIYSTAIMIGIAVGFGLILLFRFLNPYIYDKETVEGLTNTPIIGVIRKFPDHIDKDSKQALSLAKPKSVFAESVRSVRTNLSFLAANKKCKIICVTSEISGEGKSFVTVNLAATLSLIDKKVILLAADLRKSKLHKTFAVDNKKGLSTLLSKQCTLEEIIIHDQTHKIDFIPSGPVPPNPSELLHTVAMQELLNVLAPMYDYVLIDTAPVGLVSDSIPLIRNSDVNIFVIRSGVSQFRAAAIPERLSREYKLSNWAIILNAFGDDALYSNYYTTDYSRGGGNSTYYYSDYSGYAGSGYYQDENIRWWQFWKKK
jgi:tyrosine-protein kinase Etk/Wzc